MKNTQEKHFVIQKHTAPNGVHWDLMLETDDALWTWRLSVPPAEIKNEPVPAERIGDHPKRFLTYEGKVQNNTGYVEIVEKGMYSLAEQTGSTLIVDLRGTVLYGTYTFAVS